MIRTHLILLLLLLLLLLWPTRALALGSDDARKADECRAQGHANFDAMAAQMRAAGNHRDIASMEVRGRAEYLYDCDQLERSQQGRRMFSAYRRLGEVMDTLIAGAKPSAAALQAVIENADAIRGFKPASNSDPHLQRHAEYLRPVEQGPSAEQRAAPRLAPPPAPLMPNAELGAGPGAVGRLRPWGEYLGANTGQTVNVLADGSVLFAGGQTDPALVATTGEAVLASVERYEQGRVAPAPPLAVARAGHTATVLADGSVLVVGGFDARGRALRAAEHWAAGDVAWREVAGMHVSRHGHTATRLADGRVLVTGGVGITGQRLTAAELWDPRTQEWTAAPSLSVPSSGHAAALLTDGRVLVAGGRLTAAVGSVTWAWIWKPGESDWQIAGRVHNSVERQWGEPVTLVPRSDGGALVFTDTAVMRWDPRLLPAEATPPLWQRAPATARLLDGRVMFVGHGPVDHGNTQSAYLWDPARNRWEAAGHLTGGVRMHAGMLVLPSGRLLHLALALDKRFICETWDARDKRWSGCGGAALEYTRSYDVQPGLLPDGRALVLVNQYEALVFDERRNSWATWKPEWNTKGLPYGAPVRSDKPLARVQDPASGSWFEINDIAVRWWQQTNPGARLMWDAQGQQWAYVLPHTMGRDPRRLPDGCVLSARPLALFNPATGKAAALVDPGLGVASGYGTLLVLPDGTAVIAGVPIVARDPGSGFFHGNVSCKGFEPNADNVGYIAGGLAVDPPAPAPQAATTAAPNPPAPWRRQAADWVVQRRWWLLLAIVAPLLGWALLRRTRLRHVQVEPSE